MRPQKLHGDEADEAEPCDGEALAESWRGQANGFERNGANYRERRGIVIDARGYGRAQVLGNAHDFRVGAIGYYPIPRLEAGASGLEHHPGIGSSRERWLDRAWR